MQFVYPTSTDISKFLRLSFKPYKPFKHQFTSLLCLHNEVPAKAKRPKPTGFRCFSYAFVRYSIETREKTQSSGFHTNSRWRSWRTTQTGEFSSEFSSDFGISRGRKSFFWSFVLVYCVSRKFFPIILTDKRKLGLEPGSNRALTPTLWAPIHMFANYKVNNSTLKNDF